MSYLLALLFLAAGSSQATFPIGSGDREQMLAAFRHDGHALLSHRPTPVLITGLLILYATSYLVVYSNAAAMVLDPHGEVAGFATALYGFASMIGSSTIVSALVLFNGGSMISWAASLLAICLVCLALTATWRARPA